MQKCIAVLNDTKHMPVNLAWLKNLCLEGFNLSFICLQVPLLRSTPKRIFRW